MRNFPKLQLLIFFLQFSKQKHSYLLGEGGPAGKFRDKSRNYSLEVHE